MPKYEVFYELQRMDGHILEVEAANKEEAAKVAQEQMAKAKAITVHAPICGFSIKVKKVVKSKDDR